jgi:phenylacetate-CoA ligase
VRALIDHACNTTGYYRQFLGAKELSEFPILQKRTIRERYEEFFSSVYEKSSLIPVKTSGSYGTPLTFYLTKEKKARQHAEVIYFSDWAGYKIGDKHAYVSVRVPRSKSKFTFFMQNEIPMNPTVIDEEWLEKQRQVLLHKGVKVFIGYPSVIGALAEYCRAKGDGSRSFCLKAIITTSESLNDRTRVTLRQVFGCSVLSRYCTVESGVLAHECDCASRHHLNIASYVIEMLALDSDKPASPGELGRVVVTDPFSRAMPLIRYDTGDLATLGGACSCDLPRPTLQRLEGRLAELVVGADGQRISPYALNSTMGDLEDIVQFQFVQKNDKSYELRLCTLPSFHQEELLRYRLLDILGADAKLKLSYVEQIPPLPSGKRSSIISEARQHRIAE